ncbi:hypothetical protein ATANTOWER_024218 [Ataeniobius toweri]|uniref:Uncharacterized protein n=1 Tax=Ataeniobius toweri TaxID=208326 RepID=A0ABU7C3K4_9TELE|nr:hypothetical protein [Ataeniobius toweri]
MDKKLKENVQTEPVLNFIRPNHIEDLHFTSTVTSLSGSFPLGAVFILLLIHTFGAGHCLCFDSPLVLHQCLH